MKHEAEATTALPDSIIPPDHLQSMCSTGISGIWLYRLRVDYPGCSDRSSTPHNHSPLSTLTTKHPGLALYSPTHLICSPCNIPCALVSTVLKHQQHQQETSLLIDTRHSQLQTKRRKKKEHTPTTRSNCTPLPSSLTISVPLVISASSYALTLNRRFNCLSGNLSSLKT